MQLTMLNKNLYSFSINTAWLPDSARDWVGGARGSGKVGGSAGSVAARAPLTTRIPGPVLRPQVLGAPGARRVGGSAGSVAASSPADHTHNRPGPRTAPRTACARRPSRTHSVLLHVSLHRGSLRRPCPPAAVASVFWVAQPASLGTSLPRDSGHTTRNSQSEDLRASGLCVGARPEPLPAWSRDRAGPGVLPACARGGTVGASGLCLGRDREHFRPVLGTAQGRELLPPVLGAGRGPERFRLVRGAGRPPPHRRGRCARTVPAPRPAGRSATAGAAAGVGERGLRGRRAPWPGCCCGTGQTLVLTVSCFPL